MAPGAAQQERPSLRYKDVDLPVSYVGALAPADLLYGHTSRQRQHAEQRLLLKFRWPLQSPLTGEPEAASTCRDCSCLAAVSLQLNESGFVQALHELASTACCSATQENMKETCWQGNLTALGATTPVCCPLLCQHCVIHYKSFMHVH